MQLKSGNENGNGFFIGPQGKGYKAEITIDNEVKTKEFKHFNQAVKWIEQEQEEERKEIESQRHKEENT